MTNTTEFLEQHAPNGEMTPQLAAQLLELADSGDTGASSSESGAPSATQEEGQQATAAATDTDQQQDAQQEPVIDPEKAVVMAKDGIHTIPYETLIKHREGEQHWKQQATELQQRLQQLEAQQQEAQQRANAGQAPTEADVNLAIATQAMAQGVDPAVFGDMDEEGLANGVAVISRQTTLEALKEFKAELLKDLQPLQAQHQQTAEQAHFAAIAQAHPDFESIVESKELSDWIGKHPSFVQDQYKHVLANGTAAQVIELYGAFKSANPTTSEPAAAQQDVKAAAAKALERAAPAVPASLSDIPGGTAGPASKFEALANMSPADLAEAMEDMTPEQREAYLNRRL